MKSALVKSLIAEFARKPFFFLTGDLGFNMLEPLRDVMGERFINTGCAEQHMVGMAAGIAKSTGEQVFVYSIAPFLYARAFEQIRNDVCFHNLPVCLIGMGGGYHYGDLGPSHWALEDYGTMLSLPNMRCYIPAFASDIEPQLKRIIERVAPSYWRLGRCEISSCMEVPVGATDYDDVRVLGNQNVVTCGAIAATALALNPTIISELPSSGVCFSNSAVAFEEHVRHGGLGSVFGIRSVNAVHFTDGPYGSQQYMRARAGLTVENLRRVLDVGT